MNTSAPSTTDRGSAIRYLRKKAGLIQAELAEKSLLHRVTVVRAEKSGEMTNSAASRIRVALEAARAWDDPADRARLDLIAPNSATKTFEAQKELIRGLGFQTDARDP